MDFTGDDNEDYRDGGDDDDLLVVPQGGIKYTIHRLAHYLQAKHYSQAKTS